MTTKVTLAAFMAVALAQSVLNIARVEEPPPQVQGQAK